MVVSRVRLTSQSALAYKLAYDKTFSKCKSDHPEFSPGVTLLGVVTDWSDAEIQGLGGAVGTEIAKKLLRGCSVHWDRSWQRMRDRVAESTHEKKLFSKIACQIPQLDTGQHVCLSFQVLSGETPANVLVGKIKNFLPEDAMHTAIGLWVDIGLSGGCEQTTWKCYTKTIPTWMILCGRSAHQTPMLWNAKTGTQKDPHRYPFEVQ